jgi:hypothetical protein
MNECSFSQGVDVKGRLSALGKTIDHIIEDLARA